MIVTAVFSTWSWELAAGFNRTEDALHSVAATAMGVAFAADMISVLLARRPTGIGLLGPLAVTASVAIPLAMTTWSGGSGALQRLMFALAYAWYGREALDGRAASVS